MTPEVLAAIEHVAFTQHRLDLQTYLRISFYLHAEISKVRGVKSLLEDSDASAQSSEEPLLRAIEKVEQVFRLQKSLSPEDYDFARELLMSQLSSIKNKENPGFQEMRKKQRKNRHKQHFYEPEQHGETLREF